MTETAGAVTGVPRVILRAEGLGVLVAACWTYAVLGGSWWLFAALVLVPDLSMLGYLRGPRVGAALYNAAHSYLGAGLLLGLGLAADWPLGTALGLIWAAHVGLDRVLGYGLKYPWGFGATHLGALRAASRATPSARA